MKKLNMRGVSFTRPINMWLYSSITSPLSS